MAVSSSSGSAVDDVGEGVVDDAVRIDKARPPILREFMTLLQSCLYARLASVWLSSSSRPVQEQKSECNGCASLTRRGGTRFIQEPSGDGGTVGSNGRDYDDTGIDE